MRARQAGRVADRGDPFLLLSFFVDGGHDQRVQAEPGRTALTRMPWPISIWARLRVMFITAAWWRLRGRTAASVWSGRCLGG